MSSSRPILIVVSGLPGVGKSTVAARFVRIHGGSYLRIDTIEQAIVDHTPLSQPLGPVGYEVGYALAREQLQVGTRTVVVECVNPLTTTREAWSRASAAGSALLLDVEVVCTDAAEHRDRVENRTVDVPGLVVPTWQDVIDREYQPWGDRHRVVVDTAHLSPEACARAVALAAEKAREDADTTG